MKPAFFPILLVNTAPSIETAFATILRVHAIPLIVTLLATLALSCLIKNKIIRLLPCILLALVALGLAVWALVTGFDGWTLLLLVLDACYFGAAALGTAAGFLGRWLFYKNRR